MAGGRLALVVLAALLLAAASTEGGYVLSHDYSGPNFFDHFDFWSYDDPTHGYVDYVTQQQAQEWGLIKASSAGVYIGADHSSISSGRGRAAVRISSKATFNGGLFLNDLSHMPTGCGTWPAYWLCGPNWPQGGEIDILEGVNMQTIDKSTLHTSQGCDMSSVPTSSFTGHWDNYNGQTLSNCYVDAIGTLNLGCGVIANESNYGTALNQRGGGIYATEWNSNGIKMWFFWRNSIPRDIQIGQPNPSSWGKPYANFQFGSNCPSSHFYNHQIIINLTFCGTWAGDSWVWKNTGCGQYASCQNFVQHNPQAFADAYWQINSLKVYQWQ